MGNKDGRLYHFRPKPSLANLVENLVAWKLVPNDEERRVVLSENHNDPQSGHLGTHKTYERISTQYFWPGCFKEVADYVRCCPTCQSCKVEQKAPAGFMGQRIVEEPWIVVAADITGPFPRSREAYQYVLVLQDLFTKWAEWMAKVQTMRDWVIENLDNAFVRQSKHYNLRQRQVRFCKAKDTTPSSKALGVAAKMFSKFAGPYKVCGILSSTVYELL